MMKRHSAYNQVILASHGIAPIWIELQYSDIGLALLGGLLPENVKHTSGAINACYGSDQRRHAQG